MQATPQADGLNSNLVEVSRQGAARSALTPAAMARYLRRLDPLSASCFAEAMYEGSAWANETWGAYWADVVRLV